MITIKQRNDKWRIAINMEEWEVKDLKQLQEVLNKILTIKNNFGQIKKEGQWTNQ